jgi:hypothetical protein
LFDFVVDFVGALRFAIGFWVGRVGRARRVGLLIFKKQMPSCFAHGSCFAIAWRKAQKWLHPVSSGAPRSSKDSVVKDQC